MDAVEKREEEKVDFTIMHLQQVIWAKVGKESLTIRIVGEENPLHVDKEDELFNFYKDKFLEIKRNMTTNLVQPKPTSIVKP